MAGACPSAKDTQKIDKAGLKGVAKIKKSCGDTELNSMATYGVAVAVALTDPAGVVAKCILGQNDVSSMRFMMATHGQAGQFSGAPGRDKCFKTLAKSAAKLVTTIHKTATKCILKGDTPAACTGSLSGGQYVGPTNAKAAKKINKTVAKTASGLDKSCTGALASLYIPSIPGCPGAETASDLNGCVVNSSVNVTMDLIEEAFSPKEGGVVDGASVQDLINAYALGNPTFATIFVAPGTYDTGIVVPAGADGQTLIGCGLGSDRPSFENSGGGLNGITVIGVDNVTIQGLDFVDWQENGTFSSDSNNITHIDIGAYNTGTYGIFPVQSTGVVVELSTVKGANDAGIYVGQSDDIVVRYNETRDNVAGIEIENSSFASVHNNLSTANTTGLAIFKLPGLPVQSGDNHDIFHNVLNANNTPNFCGGGLVCALPRGTGLLMFSNDDCNIHHNIMTDNESLGMALLDQQMINALAGNIFDEYSPDQTLEGNRFEHNIIVRNGGNPDMEATAGLSADLVYFHNGDADWNCFDLAGVGNKPKLMGDASWVACD